MLEDIPRSDMMSRPVVFYGNNPSNIYMEAMFKLLNEGKELAPRGKRIKELRPVTIGYADPRKRLTFLSGRVINPFFQLSESFWIVTGGSDVAFLTPYNASIAQFSDDGKYFNAPYGERLRHWGKNDARGYIHCPIDQLDDVYRKLHADRDSRQAVAFIGNPEFDNSKYTLKGGKDIACNLNIKFKIREGKLDINVDNRSNDLHWGTFGANLCQFSTIQELMASWLGVEIGEYFQVTDSLHIYLDEYGAKETEKVLNAYGRSIEDAWPLPHVEEYYFDNEPRMTFGKVRFQDLSMHFYEEIQPKLNEDYTYNSRNEYHELLHEIGCYEDRYWRMTFQAMFVKQAHNRGAFEPLIEALYEMEDSSWKVSCLRFLSKRYSEEKAFKSVYKHLDDDIRNYIERKGE